MTTAAKPLPGPRPLPIVGNLLSVGRRGFMRSFLDEWPRRGDIMVFQFGPRKMVPVVHPEHHKHVLVKNKANYVKGLGVESLMHFTGKGLFTADGPLWQTQRRMIQPHFTVAAVRAYDRAMQASVTEATERMASQAAAGAIDLQFELMRFTMDVICRTMFSMSIAGGANELSEPITEGMRWIGTRGTQLIRLSPRVPTPKNLRFQRALQRIDGFLLGLIEARRRAGEVGARGDLLDVLLQATDEETGRGMSEEQLRDEMVTIFLAGHETTAVALGWTLYLLSQHRWAQEATRAEVDRALAGRTPTVDDLPALPVVRRVVDEALRLFPPVWVNPRQALEDDVIGGYHVPAGSIVGMMFYATHRHLDFWSDPERFDPDRFLPERAQGRHPMAYLPFGGGNRVCVGMNFALQEMILFVAAMAQRFELMLAPGYLFGLDPDSGTLRSREPMRMLLRPRG